MTYDNNVPQAQQTIAFTQPLINVNFAKIATEQRVNHTWTDVSGSNNIAGEDDGSHQKLHFPAQATDITGALPTGIKFIQYALADATFGNNIVGWDGVSKCAVSAKVIEGSVTLTTVNQSVFALPPSCVGICSFTDSSILGTNGTIAVFLKQQVMSNPVGCFQVLSTFATPAVIATCPFGMATIDARVASGTLNTNYKIIYWPV